MLEQRSCCIILVFVSNKNDIIHYNYFYIVSILSDELSRAPSLYQKRRPRHNTGLTGLETVSEMKSTKVLTFETVSAMTQREHSKLSKKLVTATQADSPPSALKVYNLGRRGRRHSCDILM